MEALLGLLTGGNGLLAGLLAAIVGGIALLLKGRSMGKQDERDRQIKAEYEAMSEAQRIEQEVAGNSPKSNRDALKRWGKRS